MLLSHAFLEGVKERGPEVFVPDFPARNGCGEFFVTPAAGGRPAALHHVKTRAPQRKVDAVRSANLSLFARAAAAKLLFETMSAERDESRRAYVAPLKGAIERLGRLIYGDDCQVEINEDLQIASRTYRGKTVPFDSLSVGTKEQLALIFRLAC